MAKSAVKTPQQQQTRGYHPAAASLSLSACGLLAENSSNGGIGLFLGAGAGEGGREYFPNLIRSYLTSHKLYEEEI